MAVLASALLVATAANAQALDPRHFERFFDIDPRIYDLLINNPGNFPLPNVGGVGSTFYFNGTIVRGDQIYLSPDRRNIIVDNFYLVSGRAVVRADRVTFDREDAMDQHISALQAMNLSVARDGTRMEFGVATVRTAEAPAGGGSVAAVPAMQVASTQLRISENGATKFTTKPGATGLEAVHATITGTSRNQLDIAITTEVGFTYQRNPLSPASDITIDSDGGARSTIQMDMNGDHYQRRFSYATESPVRVKDPQKDREIFLEGKITVNGLENYSGAAQNQLRRDSTVFVASADRAKIVRAGRGEVMILEGGSAQQTVDKILNETYGTATGAFYQRTRGNKDMQVFAGTYSFRQDPTRKREYLQADKAIYVNDREAVEFEGQVDGQRVTDLSTKLKSTYVSGQKMTVTTRQGSGAFTNAKLTIIENADGSEDQILDTNNGNFVKGTRTFTINGETQLRRRVRDGEELGLFEGGGKNISYVDTARDQYVTAKSAVFSNAGSDGTKDVYAVELGEALIEKLGGKKDDYVLTSATVLYEKNKDTKAIAGAAYVRDLTGQVDGYKLSVKVTKPGDPLNGQTVDFFYSKDGQLEYYSINNENGVIVGEKDGKKQVWTGGTIDFYTDGRVRFSNVRNTEFWVERDKFTGAIKSEALTYTDIRSEESAHLKGSNVSIDGKTRKGEVGVLHFGDLEIFKSAGIRNLTAQKFEGLLQRVDGKKQQSVTLNAAGMEVRNASGQEQYIKITGGSLFGEENKVERKGGLTFDQLIGMRNKEKGVTSIELDGAKFVFADAKKARDIVGGIGKLNYFEGKGVNNLSASDIRGLKVNDTKKLREILFDGKSLARYKDGGGEILILEQGQLQMTDPNGRISLNVKALDYMRDKNADLKIFKRIDVSGEGTYRGLEGKFEINAHDLQFVKEDISAEGQKVMYYGFAPISDKSHIEVIRVESGVFSVEMKGGNSAGVKVVTDRQSGQLAILGFVHNGKEIGMKAGPLKLTGHQSPTGAEVSVNLTAVGTHHQMLLQQIAGLANEIPLNSRLAYNGYGFLKAQLPIGRTWGLRVSYKGARTFENITDYYDNKANTVVLSLVKKMRSETRYGFDIGLLGTSALRVDVNHRCGIRLFGNCLGEETLVPMTAYVGVSRCSYKDGRTSCNQVGGTYDITSSVLKDARPDAPGLADGRVVGGQNLVLARSVTLRSGTTHTLSATAGNQNGIMYNFFVPLRNRSRR